ncbi:protein MAIN-LIKE 2 isoform X1 [Daucus carota subsp. sativus]|uniref:protein MAIN-LIKE 2 isoform X1 n=2 Tax=Daucus carota subsp. sativus TaxID=79200 RepID=UPI0007EF5A4B|nr:PREDICTED: uncharacterized protein LOC108215755 isoform X3 [Daucus carota subsp. sativus]
MVAGSLDVIDFPSMEEFNYKFGTEWWRAWHRRLWVKRPQRFEPSHGESKKSNHHCLIPNFKGCQRHLNLLDRHHREAHKNTSKYLAVCKKEPHSRSALVPLIVLQADNPIIISSSATMPKRPRLTVFDKDLKPAQRTIPDTSLLHNLGNHLSVYARAGRGPPTQNLNCRGAWRTALKLYRVSHYKYKELFIAAGFGDFLEIEPVDLPVAYSLALMERWFSETNTLHLPCGEIGPTPVDWTMVTGLRFGGKCIGVNTNFSMDRALYLLGKPNAKKNSKILLSAIIPKEDEVQEDPLDDDTKEKVFRRLFLYVVSSCFFSNDHSTISHKLVECLERVDEAGNYDWGAITFSAFLSGMRRKVTAETGAFTAFWQFLTYWAFEYLDINRPKARRGNVFPRAKRWICPETSTENANPHFFGPQFIACRCQLNYVEESQVTWVPYPEKCYPPAMLPTIKLAKKRIPFRSIETWEYYLGERCLRQLSSPRQVPKDPPQIMHGTGEGQNDVKWKGIPAEDLVDRSLEYPSWFANASIGRILNVNPFLGGLNLAEKLLSQWMEKHQPDLIPISQAEYIKMKEDRNALEEECAKLREELSRAKEAKSSQG